MDEFVVSARKYRPQEFASVVGQASITETLKNSIVRKHLAHAYLFCGPRGVGKTTCARIFAKTINCATPTPDMEACNACESCRSFSEGRSYCIHEMDAASNNSVDDIRQLIEKVRIPPQVGQYSVYIIDEVHMLSSGAFNAFLKTLEEPPAHAIFILATTEKHKIIPTILSRCQIYDFNRIRVEDTVAYLKLIAQREGTQAEEAALHVIAQKADGAMRDALSIYDQVVSFCGSELTYAKVVENLNVLDYDYYFRLTSVFLQGSYAEVLLIFNEILSKGFEAQHFIAGLSTHFRDLLVCKDAQTLPLLEASEAIKKRYREQALACEASFLLHALGVATRCEAGYKASGNPRLHVELGLLQISALIAEKASGEAAPVAAAVAAPKAPVAAAPAPSTLAPPPAAASPAAAAPPKTIQIKDVLNNTAQRYPPPAAPPRSAESVAENQAFTAAQLQAVVGELIASLSEPRAKLKSALTGAECTVEADGRTITIEAQGEFHLKDLSAEREMLTHFLQKHLHNSGIAVALRAKEVEKTHKLYTPQERYNFLATQNPLLAQLRQKLELDYE